VASLLSQANVYQTAAAVTVSYSLSNTVDYQTVSTCSWTTVDTESILQGMQAMYAGYSAAVSLEVLTQCPTNEIDSGDDADTGSGSSAALLKGPDALVLNADSSDRHRRLAQSPSSSPPADSSLSLGVSFTTNNFDDIRSIDGLVGTSANGVLASQMTAEINKIGEFVGAEARVASDSVGSAEIFAAVVLPVGTVDGANSAVSVFKSQVDGVLNQSVTRDTFEAEVRSILGAPQDADVLPLVGVTRKDLVTIPPLVPPAPPPPPPPPPAPGTPGQPVNPWQLFAVRIGSNKKADVGVIIGIVLGCVGATVLLVVMGMHNSSLLAKLAVERRYMMNFYGKTVAGAPPPVAKSPTMRYQNGRFMREDSSGSNGHHHMEDGHYGGHADDRGAYGYAGGAAGVGGGGVYDDGSDFQYDNPFYATHAGAAHAHDSAQVALMYGDHMHAADPSAGAGGMYGGGEQAFHQHVDAAAGMAYHPSIAMSMGGGMGYYGYGTEDPSMTQMPGTYHYGGGMEYEHPSGAVYGDARGEEVHRDETFNRARASTAFGEDLLNQASAAAAAEDAAAGASAEEPAGRCRSSTAYGESLLNSAASAAAYQHRMGAIDEDDGGAQAPPSITRASTLYGLAASSEHQGYPYHPR